MSAPISSFARRAQAENLRVCFSHSLTLSSSDFLLGCFARKLRRQENEVDIVVAAFHDDPEMTDWQNRPTDRPTDGREGS